MSAPLKSAGSGTVVVVIRSTSPIDSDQLVHERPRKIRMSIATITIPTGASRDAHLLILNDLESHVLARPETLDLRLGGEPLMPPSIAAAYLALIVRFQSTGGDVVASAVTALAGPSAVLWLHGTIRRINPGCFVVFTSTSGGRVEHESSMIGAPPDLALRFSNPEAECYRRLMRRADRFLRIEDVLDRPLFEQDLRELLLVGPVAPIEPASRTNPSSNVRAFGQQLWDQEPPASQLLS